MAQFARARCTIRLRYRCTNAGVVAFMVGASGLASRCLDSFCIAVSIGPCYSALKGDLCDSGARQYANQKGAR